MGEHQPGSGSARQDHDRARPRHEAYYKRSDYRQEERGAGEPQHRATPVAALRAESAPDKRAADIQGEDAAKLIEQDCLGKVGAAGETA